MIAAAVVAAFAFAVPAAQADEIGAMHYSCGQARPPQLDGSALVSASTTTGVYRGSSFGCGANGTMVEGDGLDYYCYTNGNDGDTWTYVSVYQRGFAGWANDDFLPNHGSLVHCPI
jgi:hypothetical protein